MTRRLFRRGYVSGAEAIADSPAGRSSDQSASAGRQTETRNV